MADLSKLFCEERDNGATHLELVKCFRCPKCEGVRFSYWITIRNGDRTSGQYVNVSLLLVCDSCGRNVSVHPQVEDGTSLHLFGAGGIDISALLCRRYAKVIPHVKRKTSTAPKSSKTRNGSKGATFSSRTAKGRR